MNEPILAFHCLQVIPNRVNKITQELQGLGLEVVVVYEHISRRANPKERALTGQSRVTIQRPMFDGYIFYRGHNIAGAIMQIQGVIAIITNKPNYSPVPQKAVYDLIIAQNKGDFDRTKLLKNELAKMIGLKHEINGGAFDGIEAVITAVNDDGQAMGEIDFMGKKQIINIGNVC